MTVHAMVVEECWYTAMVRSTRCHIDVLYLTHMLAGGISLSPAFVIMYAMQFYKINWEEALHLVQNRRYCISPNGGFLQQIKVRAPILVPPCALLINRVPGVRVYIQSNS